MKKFIVILLGMITISTIVQATSFEDLEGLNCKAAVESLENIGIVNGVNVKEYAPNKSVTRAELSKMILGALNEKTSNTKSFSDIHGHWGETYIQQAGGLGILNGYEDGTFQPDKEVSYAEAIAILLRSLGYHLENASGKWYENYISKMNEIGLNEGIEIHDVESFANRGDIAILLWNTIKSRSNGESLLEKNFSEYEYFEGKKIIAIDTLQGRIVYRTSDFYFYVDSNINFSDIGGLASGFFDSKNLTVIGLEVDSGRNLKKISGNTKEINAKGYDIFECNDISGYGAKEKANYVEIFVNDQTDKTQRVVYYDTSESHFASSMKIATSKIKIESKDVYDNSIIVHEGKTINLKILRTETVKEIDANALLVSHGKIVSWTAVPDNSVIREISKNKIYTYYHEYQDVSLDSKSVNAKGLKIDEVYHPFSEECIAENVDTETSVNLIEGLTKEDIQEIVEKDNTVRVYFNEFGEIVKFEFSYDIWKVMEEETVLKEREELEPELKKIGIVSSFGWVASSRASEDDKVESKISSYPRKSIFTYIHSDGAFQLGDFVYLKETETKNGKTTKTEKKLNKITENMTIDNLKVVTNYTGYIEGNRLGVYPINEETEYFEVLLTRSKNKEGEYSKCYMSVVDSSYFGENTKYKKMHLVLNQDNVVLRVYAIKEIGSTLNVGIVKDIDVQMSGDEIVSKTVSITLENKGVKKFLSENIDLIHQGDLITYDVVKSTDKKEYDKLIVDEVYNHEAIGSDKDFIVESYTKKGIITFQKSNDVIDLSKDSFQIGNREYDLDDYIFVNAQIVEDTTSGEWRFRYFSLPTMNSVRINAGDRFVVDELTKVIVVYSID